MKHGYNGLIVKSGDVNQLSETIDFALHNPYKMEIMAKHAREISKQYNLLRYTSEWDNFISKFISY
jgi:glycosyltransferase involved in cell wall biosynthesis